MNQIQSVIHELHSNMYLEYKFQVVTMNVYKVIHIQNFEEDEKWVFFDHFGQFFWINYNFFL